MDDVKRSATLSIRLPRSMYNGIVKVARASERTKGAVIRLCVKDALPKLTRETCKES